MAVITWNGLVGSGGPEIGAEVARILGMDYVDRLILAEAAKRLGATVEALVEKESRPPTFRERLGRFIQTALQRSAAAGTGGDPYFGPGLETLLGREYAELPQEPLTRAQELDDTHFWKVTCEVIKELAQAGNVVIIGRGSNIILKDEPGTFHVGTGAPLEKRIELIMHREQLSREKAERYVADNDRARMAYFKKHFGVDHPNAQDYHMTLNTGLIDFKTAAAIVARAASDIVG